MDPPAADERSSLSLSLDLDLEHSHPEPERFHLRKAKTVMAREMKKKRLTFRQNHEDPRADYSRPLALAETSPAEAATARATAGILRRGRFQTKRSHASASSSHDDPLDFLGTPRQRRFRFLTLIVINAIGVLSVGMAACFLLGGQIQVLPSMTAPVHLRKLRGAPASNLGEGSIKWRKF